MLTIASLLEFGGALFLRFAEIPDEGSNRGWFWHVGYFQPLVHIDQDVALFAPLLRTRAPEPEAVDA